ncbi:MAG: hypothetical protein JRI23_05430 [Deltaproteobacteria bacterium]|jgi:hypothetical protein|nr:hypothetical protein [Deltaproteobacteria bacterium]MBW2530994.1 hypothetical protein [Deltaproteobacteria bacterium]
MARTEQQLEARVQRLAESGADALRVEALECARQFKRSWVQMADALRRVKEQSAYEAWGYRDLYSYCAEELLIKKATVDKLTASYGALERYAPKALAADGVETPLPPMESIHYYAKAVGDDEAATATATTVKAQDVLDELHRAVFEEMRPVQELRKEFNPVLYAKSEQDQLLERLQRARAGVRRLVGILPDLEGISTRTISEVEAALQALHKDLERLIAQVKQEDN